MSPRHPPDHAPQYDLRRRGGRLARVCAVCKRNATNAYRARNREKVRRYGREWWRRAFGVSKPRVA